MGVVIRLLVFVVGALGLVLTGLIGAQTFFGVDTQAMLANLGEAPAGVAASAQQTFASGLAWLGEQIAGAMGAADADNPGPAANYGPMALAALTSVLLVFFATRRA